MYDLEGSLICEKEIKAIDEAILFNVEDFLVTIKIRLQKTSLKFIKK